MQYVTFLTHGLNVASSTFWIFKLNEYSNFMIKESNFLDDPPVCVTDTGDYHKYY